MITARSKNIRISGFILIELLIVVALIAILVAIAVPQYTLDRIRTSNAMALSDLRGVRQAMEAYFADNSCYPRF